MEALRLIPLLLLLPALTRGLPHDPFQSWQTLKTPHFEMHFPGELARQAPLSLARCEEAHARLRAFWGFAPESVIHVVLTDESDEANGSATPLPWNTIRLFLSPPDDVFAVDEYDDWFDYLITHELTHIFHMDHAEGGADFFRSVFGRIPLFGMPAVFQPPWVLEGLATWAETDKARGQGRGQSSYYRALMRMEVQNGIKGLRHVNQPVTDWPVGTTRYLYGVYFLQFLESKYGMEKAKEWIREYSDDWLPFFINRNAKKVTGSALPALWTEFEAWLKADFGAEAEAIRGRGILDRHVSSAENMYLERGGGYFMGPVRELRREGRLEHYYVRRDQKSQARLRRFWALNENMESAEDLAKVNTSRFSLDPARKRALVIEGGWINQSRWVTDLVEVDLDSGRKRRLSRGLRVREAVAVGNGIVATLLSSAGKKDLVLLDAEGRYLERLWRGEQEENFRDLEPRPGGGAVLLSRKIRGRSWDIEEFDLAARTWKPLVATQSQEVQPHYVSGTATLHFSSDYGGVYNIYRLEPGAKKPLQLTNTLGGAFHPQDGIYLSLGPRGFGRGILDPQGKPELAPLPARGAPSGLAAALSPSTKAPASYSPWSSLAPSYWQPMLNLSPGYRAYGFATSGSDALDRHAWRLVGMLDQDFKQHGSASYTYQRWIPGFSVSAYHYTDTIPHVAERTYDGVSAELSAPWHTAWRSFGASLGALGEQAHDSWIASGYLPRPDERSGALSGLLWYDATRRYPQSLGPADGLAASAYYVKLDPGDPQAGAWASWQLSRPTRLIGRSLLELSAGGGRITEGGLVWGLSLAPRQALGLPRVAPTLDMHGYDPALPTRKGGLFSRLHTGLRFPLGNPEWGIMAPPVGIDKFYGRLAYDTSLVWNLGGEPAQPRPTLGAELVADLVLGYAVPMDIRVGWRRGLDAGGVDDYYFLLNWFAFEY